MRSHSEDILSEMARTIHPSENYYDLAEMFRTNFRLLESCFVPPLAHKFCTLMQNCRSHYFSIDLHYTQTDANTPHTMNKSDEETFCAVSRAIRKKLRFKTPFQEIVLCCGRLSNVLGSPIS
mmetsp:Transcript_16244/g.22652  ORF Transcript_16244/g.22652 Transcript_16244/m.22652 type:complete len:122 (-) Transcript_16244:95-460(-)